MCAGYVCECADLLQTILKKGKKAWDILRTMSDVLSCISVKGF